MYFLRLPRLFSFLFFSLIVSSAYDNSTTAPHHGLMMFVDDFVISYKKCIKF